MVFAPLPVRALNAGGMSSAVPFSTTSDAFLWPWAQGFPRKAQSCGTAGTTRDSELLAGKGFLLEPEEIIALGVGD